MEVYRISKSKYINDLSGIGARLHGGRWNRVGIPVLYTSALLPLALLELIVNFNSKSAFKQNYSYVKLDIPETAFSDVRDMIDIERDRNDTGRLHKITEQHFFELNALALRVPSFVLPQESNIIINPLHPDFSKVKVILKDEVKLDKRLLA